MINHNTILESVQNGHKSLSFLMPFSSKEIDILMGKNLKRLRLGANFTQEKLAERLDVSERGLIPKWESGKKGIGKKVLSKLCELFKVKPYEFYVTEDAPIITEEKEKECLYMIREAKQLQVAEEIVRYGKYRISEAQIERRDDKSKDSLAQKQTKRRRSA